MFSRYTFLLLVVPWLAWADEDITARVDRLRLTKQGVVVTLTYENHLNHAMQVTLEWPTQQHIVLVDDQGREYALSKSAGMERRHENGDYDLIYHTNHHAYDPKKNSVYLSIPAKGMRQTTFTFTRPADAGDVQSFDLTIGHRARRGIPGGQTFTFTAHASGVTPTP